MFCDTCLRKENMSQLTVEVCLQLRPEESGHVSTGSECCSSTLHMVNFTGIADLFGTELLALHLTFLLTCCGCSLSVNDVFMYNWPWYTWCPNIVKWILSVMDLYVCVASRCVVPRPGDHGGWHPLPRRTQWYNPKPVLRRLQHDTGAALSVSRDLWECRQLMSQQNGFFTVELKVSCP